MKLPIKTPKLEQTVASYDAITKQVGPCACMHCLTNMIGGLAQDAADHINADGDQPNTSSTDVLIYASAMMFASMKLKPEELGGRRPEMLFMQKCAEALAVADSYFEDVSKPRHSVH